ncbi:hypothetical protein GCM10018980_71890 [Streptomyces capoamus]|uniref:Uncharacterized protein n=1 Tax=Streptomyces capoamus TaxID=68183 RepID=A0A919F311_9ACTN|nr:hypothetical protein [Streptomyces capoamus]GGW13343.1 hypothetical protein GCM10010501_16530 [Streptomyces libani subsp. rufus]GHG74798.1 hypothetical protein GCM10018980_71890 [Streptomyces capoamus]
MALEYLRRKLRRSALTYGIHKDSKGGTITIEQDDVDVDAKSLLKLSQKFPPRYEQVMVLSFTITMDEPYN